ncbi:hypothetical protein SDC9_193429 [bioreactor metagenome]|uniref:Uncharacterized protein n=1 Tax=bioreactor metagenome TaxID=1076179 RepID=A0A645IC34_9ZZZZ
MQPVGQLLDIDFHLSYFGLVDDIECIQFLLEICFLDVCSFKLQLFDPLLDGCSKFKLKRIEVCYFGIDIVILHLCFQQGVLHLQIGPNLAQLGDGILQLNLHVIIIGLLLIIFKDTYNIALFNVGTVVDQISDDGIHIARTQHVREPDRFDSTINYN